MAGLYVSAPIWAIIKLVYRHFKHKGKSVLKISFSFVRSLSYRLFIIVEIFALLECYAP